MRSCKCITLHARHLFTKSSLVPFDSLQFINSLTEGGFTEAQANAIGGVFSSVLLRKYCYLEQECMKTEEFETFLSKRYLQKLSFQGELEEHLRKSVLEINLRQNELVRDFASLSQLVQDSLCSLNNEVRIELLAEKAKIKNTLLKAQLELQDLRTSIDVECSNTDASLIKLRNEIFYTSIGYFFTATVAFLGYLRYCS